jgi:hypothetical protein
MSRTAQCHQPEGIGASGSKQVSKKLAVFSGKPSQARSGESEPARAVADSGIGAPSVRVDEVRVKLGISMPSKGTGARGRVSMDMCAPFLVPPLSRMRRGTCARDADV